MRRRLFGLALLLVGATTLRADENVTRLQDRLKADGFYFGKTTGIYDSETAAAVTRFQIRSGLAISGKLDAATAKTLQVAPAEAAAEPRSLAGTWRRLRNGDLQFIEATSPSVATTAPSPASSPVHATRPSPTSSPGKEQLRDYVAAFILAGIDPRIGSELEFFANQVNYFGEQNVSRDRIKRDLIRYDGQWPERRFWLDGDIQVQHQTNNAIKLIFRLRYELRGGNKHASGKVTKSLTLFRGSNNQLEIIAVDERKG